MAVISELVIAELLVKPLQMGDERLADAYAGCSKRRPAIGLAP
jgi:hypothetical protein